LLIFAMKKILIITTIALIAIAAKATIINIPADYATIAEGIAASVSGDTVLVAPGAYWESFSFGGKNILLSSSHGPDTTAIRGRAVIEDGEDSTCILRGFYISNPSDGSSSIFCGNNSSPIIEGNIVNNHYGYGGGAISIAYGNCIIRHNKIENNSNVAGAGGIEIAGRGARIEKNIIANNISFGYIAMGGGIFFYENGSADITFNIFAYNQAIGNIQAYGTGGGIYLGNVDTEVSYSTHITNNTFVGNSALNDYIETGGGAVVIVQNDRNDSLIIINNIFAYNVSSSGIGTGACVVINDSGYFQWDYNCVYDNSIYGIGPGAHDVFLDPLFVDTANSDFHLQDGSPCIDAGDPISPLDPDSTRADIGALFYDQGVDIDDPDKPTGPFAFELHQNYPNPFNGQTMISYILPNQTVVSLSIFDITGRLVKDVIIEELQEAGTHNLIWYGTDNAGQGVSTAIYFYQLTVNNHKQSKSMILIK